MSKWQEVSSELDINYDSDTEVSAKSFAESSANNLFKADNNASEQIHR